MWLPLEHPLPGTWPATQACALTGNQTSDPLVCRMALNPRSPASQGSTSFLNGCILCPCSDALELVGDSVSLVSFFTATKMVSHFISQFSNPSEHLLHNYKPLYFFCELPVCLLLTFIWFVGLFLVDYMSKHYKNNL